MKADKVYARARTILVDRHKEEYLITYKEEQRLLSIPSYYSNPSEYHRLKSVAATKAKVFLMQKYHDEFTIIKWKIRTGELQ